MDCDVSYEYRLKGASSNDPWNIQVLEPVFGVPDGLGGDDQRLWLERYVRENASNNIEIRNMRIRG